MLKALNVFGFLLLLTQAANSAGTLNPFVDTSANTDRSRLGGYKEFRDERKIVNREREKGQVEYLEEEEKWARNHERARIEWAKREKERKDAKAEQKRYHDWMDDKSIEVRERVNLERKYIADKKKVRTEWKRPVTELEELEVYASRPRYEQKKRVLYGAKSSFKGINPGSSSSTSGGSSGSSFGGSNAGYQPPSTAGAPMDEFGDPGYVPPPVMPDPGMDPNSDMSAMPIPPPPPPFEDGEFPPPPPPPPGFEDGDQF